MKLLLLTHGEFLDPAHIASGNSVRAYYLARALAEAGHRVLHLHPAALGKPPAGEPLPGIRVRTYADEAQLANLIRDERPEALLVGYWELIEQLPPTLDVPLILDVVAPRILEAMYQEERDLADEVRRTLACYRRADRFLVGNQRQASFLTAWLVLAGFDCRDSAPIDVLPISTELPEPDGAQPPAEPLRLVSGGVSWPWRRADDWFEALAQALARHGAGRARLTLLSGRYRYATDAGEQPDATSAPNLSDSIVERLDLLPYGAMQGFLREHCQIGLELADDNPERRHSQSFRAMEFLRNGLPLICNAYLELAEAVRAYDAGWVIERRDALDGLIAELLTHPEQIARKSANARRLVAERFDYRRTIEPLIDYLRRPERQHPAEPLIALHEAAPPPTSDQAPLAAPSPMPAAPSRHQRLRAWAKRRLKNPLVSVTRTLGGLYRTDAVLMVSRADIHPANHGAAVKIERTAWGLSQAVSAVYLMSDARDHYIEVREGIFRKRRYPFWLRWLGPHPDGVDERLLAAGIPRDDAFLYRAHADWSFIARALWLALRHGARLYVAEFPAYARATVWARRLLGGQALLVEHNVEYQRLSDQNPGLAPPARALLRTIELDWCQRSDAVITVSEADRQRLLADGVAPQRLHVIPHGVDLDAFARAQALDLHARYAIPDDHAILVYHGIYLYPPNLEAMEVMAHEILPRLERLGVKASVLAIGAHPPAQSPHPHLHFTGAVDEVAPLLLGADLAVVPLRQGGGTRMKILDYFAAGLAVVSTAKGAEGIPVENGREVRLADDPEDFARAIAELLADAPARQRLGAAARAFVEPLDWRAITRRYLDLAAS